MDTKNLILAIAASLAILLGWQTFIEQPRQAEKQAELEVASGAKVLQMSGVAGEGVEEALLALLTFVKTRRKNDIQKQKIASGEVKAWTP